MPIVYTSSTNAHSGTNSLRLYGVGYFCLPPVDVPLDSLQLSFWNYATTWLLDPRAPKVEKPEAIHNLHEKIEKMTMKGGAFHVRNDE